jgi:hypothetical protein
MTEKELKELHKQAFNNSKALEKVMQAGCFYCCQVIDTRAIREWVDRNNSTALCPHCGIDSLLPGCIDTNLLVQMYNRWFNRKE